MTRSAAAYRRPTVDGLILFVFLVAVALLGGSSRADTLSLVILRPLAALFLAVGVVRSFRRWKDYRMPIAFLLAGVLVVAAQLVPLPPSIWTSLPGREPLVEVMRVLKVPDVWRPLSMQPARTSNALFSLLVPAATLFLCIAAGPRGTRQAAYVLLALGGLGALLGVLQVIGPDSSPLYLYRNTGEGFANGLFANRNHHAAFIACLFPLIAIVAAESGKDQHRGQAVQWMLSAFALFLIALLLMTGSRAGLLLGMIGMGGGMWLFSLGRAPRGPRPSRRFAAVRRWAPALLAVGALTLLIVLSVVAARAPSIARLFGDGMEGGRRLVVYPTVLRMVPIYFPFGSGFGTFAEVFQINEPDAILGPTYLNQAHNDWLQILIEGGLAAAVAALAALAALVRLSMRMLSGPVTGRTAPLLGRAGLIVLVVIALASVVDYPARAPSIAALVVVALMWMLDAFGEREREGWQSDVNPPRSRQPVLG